MKKSSKFHIHSLKHPSNTHGQPKHSIINAYHITHLIVLSLTLIFYNNSRQMNGYSHHTISSIWFPCSYHIYDGIVYKCHVIHAFCWIQVWMIILDLWIILLKMNDVKAFECDLIRRHGSSCWIFQHSNHRYWLLKNSMSNWNLFKILTTPTYKGTSILFPSTITNWISTIVSDNKHFLTQKSLNKKRKHEANLKASHFMLVNIISHYH